MQIKSLKKYSLMLLTLIGMTVLWVEPSMAVTSSTMGKVYEALVEHCWSCTTIGQFFDLMAHLVIVFSAKIAAGIKDLMVIVFGIWLLFQAGRLILPFGASKQNNIVGELGRRTFLVAIVFILLTSPHLIWKYLMDPMIYGSVMLSERLQGELLTGTKTASKVSSFQQAVFDFGQLVSTQTTDFQSIITGTINIGLDFMFSGLGNNPKCTDYNDIYEQTNFAYNVDNLPSEGSEFKSNIRDSRKSLIRQVCMLQLTMGAPMAAAHATMSKVIRTENALFETEDPYYAGMILFIIFGLILVAYPLFLIEAFFKIGVIGVFSPILAVLIIIPSLQKITINAVKAFFQAVVTILFLAIITGIGAILMTGAMAALGGDNILLFLGNIAEHIGSQFFNYTPSFFNTLIDKEQQQSGISLISPVFWSLTVVGVITLLMITRAGSLAASLVGGQDTGAAGAATQMGMSYSAMAGMRGGGAGAANMGNKYKNAIGATTHT